MSYEYEVKIKGERVDVSFDSNAKDFLDVYRKMPDEVMELAGGGDEAIDNFELTDDVLDYTVFVLGRVTNLPNDVIESTRMETRFKLFSVAMYIVFDGEVPDEVEEELECSSDYKYESDSRIEVSENGTVDLEDWR